MRSKHCNTDERMCWLQGGLYWKINLIWFHSMRVSWLCFELFSQTPCTRTAVTNLDCFFLIVDPNLPIHGTLQKGYLKFTSSRILIVPVGLTYVNVICIGGGGGGYNGLDRYKKAGDGGLSKFKTLMAEGGKGGNKTSGNYLDLNTAYTDLPTCVSAVCAVAHGSVHVSGSLIKAVWHRCRGILAVVTCEWDRHPLEPQGLSLQALTFSEGARFIAWRLRRPFVRRVPT